MVRTGKKLMTGLAGFLFCCLVAASGPVLGAMPEIVEMKTLSDMYEGVVFDHDLHTMITDGCAVCHHHTTGTPVVDSYCARCHADDGPLDTVSCKGCHSYEAVTAERMQRQEGSYRYHDDKPDLKGAYHLSCLGCHMDYGAPVGCQDCHTRSEQGDKFFRSGRYAPAGSAAR